MITGDMEILSDAEIISGILERDEQIIRYFFFKKCTPMFHFVINRICKEKQEKNELINELYLYLQENDWYKLRQFDYRSQLMTWLSVVAIRFFTKKQVEPIDYDSSNALNVLESEDREKQLHRKLDVEILINGLPNERYRLVIRELILRDKTPQEVAKEMNITVENLYNIKRRALQQLAQIVGKDGSYGRHV
jgi:RNA polymerase sigma factor (sigma-70 family)